MGNHISCTLSKPLGKHTRSAKVIFPGGEIRQIQTPIKAAELMLEKPNFFLVNSRSLKIGQRFSPLNADEDLEPKNVYVMFPMKKRATSKITATDMATLFVLANKAVKRCSSGKVRNFPESESAGEEVAACTAPVPKLDDMEEFSQPEYVYRLSVSRSKKPLLETIEEETTYAR